MQKKTSILKVLIDHIHLYEHLAQRAVWRIFILWTIKKKKEFSSLDYATEVYRKILKPMLCSSALNQWQAGFRYSNATLWLALTVICQFYSCRIRNRKVRISIGFSVTSHGEGSLTPRGRGFDFFSERLTHQAFKCLTIEDSNIIRVNNNCSQSNSYPCSTAGGSCHLSIDLPLNSSQTLRAPQE